MLLKSRVILGTVVMLERARLCAKKERGTYSRSLLQEAMLHIVLP